MDKQKLVLIIVIIALIGVVAVLSAYVLGLNQELDNNSNDNINNLTVSNNTAENKTQDNPQVNQNNYIGKEKAKQIAQSFLHDVQTTNYEIRRIDFVTINGVPIYRVSFWDYHILYDGTEAGWGEVYVGAKDGKIYDSYGGRY